ncbi:uncharacterized protein LOC131947686 [Physella acuta]|uniref:uncharacterized protein LOC131947686 n=1 Tax=Physella acuta TaxID=109671 RepID=UPI0027DD2C2C|nr:uncharacterized protein LOC131947686 [Physella acuta]
MSIFLFFVACLPLMVNAVNVTQVAYEVFRRIDTPQDGHLTKAEVLTYFDSHDLNHDARVTRVEYEQRVDQLYRDPDTNHLLRQIFPGLDTDNNNFLDNADYDDIFAIADTNKNNMITVEEFTRYFTIIAT